MSRKTHRRAIAALESIYARLPRVACRGLCAQACGSVPMTTLEAERLRQADPRRRLPMITPDVRCIYLTAGDRCGVYAVRPLICRVFGTVKRLSCFRGCTPDRWLSDQEFVAIAKQIERIGGEILIPTTGAPTRGETFADLAPTLPADVIEHFAEMTRTLRALHGGRIFGVAPTPPGEAPQWIDLDARRAEKGRS